jgi:hypothetical protein
MLKSKKYLLISGIIFLILILLGLGYYIRQGPIFQSKLNLNNIQLSKRAESFSGMTDRSYLIFRKVTADPFKVHEGEEQQFLLKISDSAGVKKVSALLPHDLGTDTKDMQLVEGNQKEGTWYVKWQTHDLSQEEYKMTFKAENLAGQTAEIAFFWQYEKNTQTKKANPTQRLWYAFLDNKPQEAQAGNCSFTPNTNNAVSSDCSISGVDGVDGGNLTVNSGKTLQLNSDSHLIFNPNKQISVGGDIWVNQLDSEVYKGYICVTDNDGDGCWMGNKMKSDSATCSDLAPGKIRLKDASHYPDCDDNNTSGIECCTDGCHWDAVGTRCWTGTYGSCSGGTYSSICDESKIGSKSRSYKTCSASHTCSDSHTESTSCTITRDTDGTRCWTGTYGSCSGGTYSSICDESKTGSKSRSYKTCSAGSCSDSHTESTSCTITRDTDGTRCWTGTYGSCSGGSYSSTCDESKTGSKSRSYKTCSSASCSDSHTESTSCTITRDTDGTICSTSNYCGSTCSWYTGKKCNNGSCSQGYGGGSCNPKKCSGGSCSNICESSCGADAGCDGKTPGSSCASGAGTCNNDCECKVTSISLPPCPFSDTAGIWARDYNVDWDYDNICDGWTCTHGISRCRIGENCKCNSKTDAFFVTGERCEHWVVETGASTFRSSGIGSYMSNKTVLCKTANASTNNYPACQFSGDAGDVYATPISAVSEGSYTNWANDKSKWCKVSSGGGCSYDFGYGDVDVITYSNYRVECKQECGMGGVIGVHNCPVTCKMCVIR